MDEKDKELMVMLLTLCRLTETKTNPISLWNTLKKVRGEVDRFEEGINPFGLNPPG